MNDHFTITITDDNGVKQFNLHHFVKQAIIYALGFIGALALISIATMLYLNYSVDEIQEKRDGIESAYLELQDKNEDLKASMNDTRNSLLLKKQELNELSDSLSKIETLIGIAPLADTSLQERVNLTKLNSEHMATLLQLIPNGSPVEYKGITSKFGYRIHPTLNRREFHRGSDMKAKMNTPVYATADGIVEYAGLHKKSGYGRLIILQHALGFRSYFGHLNKIVIKSTRFVKKGDLIAYSGNTGMSNGPHLHYEIRFIHNAVNPFYFIKWNVKNYYDIFQKEKKIPWQSLITATANLRVIKPTQTLPSSQLAQKSTGK
ncbi:MAG: peptidoglycan DD-metalloendopeptidase family protein [Sulfurimonas sp.]|nr:peptidoglycan DD-metalloendopeptidase family protein [Sulfurimonas sp.]